MGPTGGHVCLCSYTEIHGPVLPPPSLSPATDTRVPGERQSPWRWFLWEPG